MPTSEHILKDHTQTTIKPLKYAGTAGFALGLSKDGLDQFSKILLKIAAKRAKYNANTALKLKEIADYIQLDTAILVSEIEYLTEDQEIHFCLKELKIQHST